MSEPLVYMNGQWLPGSSAAIPLWDSGFVLGATVTEQLRTFSGRIFRPDEHFRRLARSLAIARIDLPNFEQLPAIAQEIVERNWALIPPESDLGLAVLVTPGPYATLAPVDTPRAPTLCLHTYPLPFQLWPDQYRHGQHLAVSTVRQVSAASWPRELKCRSRMHYYLADQEVAQRFPGARALLADDERCVIETATANLLASFDGQSLVSPPPGDILPGVTLGVVRELAAGLGIEWTERRIRIEELRTACEVLATSTPSCLLPVVQLDGQPVATASPGPLYRRLLDAFRELAGIDFVAQAERFSTSTRTAT